MRYHLSLYVQKAGKSMRPMTIIDESLEFGDVVYLGNYLFRGGPPPCEP